jgi:hypothetical protein
MKTSEAPASVALFEAAKGDAPTSPVPVAASSGEATVTKIQKKRGPKKGSKRTPKPEVEPASEVKLKADGTPKKKPGPKKGTKRGTKTPKVSTKPGKKPGRPKQYNGTAGSIIAVAASKVQELEKQLIAANKVLSTVTELASTFESLGI